MHSASLVALCALLQILPATATRSLSVALTGPATVENVENLQVKVTITNTGDEALKLLHEPHTPLNTAPTDTFSIVGPNNASPVFTGIRVKYSLAHAITSGAYTVLTPGQAVTVTNDLSKAYDFSNASPAVYHIDTKNVFLHVNDDGSTTALQATHDVAYPVRLTGSLAPRRATTLLDKRATFANCSVIQKDAVRSAIPAAKHYTQDSINFLNLRGAYAAGRYKNWFGAYEEKRYGTIRSNYEKVLNASFETFQYVCEPSDNCPDGAIAYVYPNIYKTVHLCPTFFRLNNTGTDSKAGTLIHETSHFTAVAGTADLAYGTENCKKLAIDKPEDAARNADSHEYFAENPN